MGHHSEAFIGIDTAKLRNAVAVAVAGRKGEVRYLGEIDTSEVATRKLVAGLAGKYRKLTFCYEAGPTGYGLQRLIESLGHTCIVVAPSLIPTRPDDRVKTNRRDAEGLARLLRAGELTAVWVPDARHEAMRELTRARDVARQDLTRKAEQATPRSWCSKSTRRRTAADGRLSLSGILPSPPAYRPPPQSRAIDASRAPHVPDHSTPEPYGLKASSAVLPISTTIGTSPRKA